MSTYSFLVDTYETEILKITGTWEAFPEDTMNFRPATKSRTVLEQVEHQVKSEGGWMRDMLGIDVGEILPKENTKRAFIEKYASDATKRLAILREKPDSWWQEDTKFFDVPRSRAWVLLAADESCDSPSWTTSRLFAAAGAEGALDLRAYGGYGRQGNL